jgi:hypothetical protein
VSTPKGTSDEAIGRPGPWSETRYEQPGQPIDQQVNDPADKAEAKPPSTPSTPVTKEDYLGKTQ